MSKIYFLYSKNELPAYEALEKIETGSFHFNEYPYLQSKVFLYELLYPFQCGQQADEFLSYIKTSLDKEESVTIVVLEQTQLKEEIKFYNTEMENTIKIRLNIKDREFYGFKYALERGVLKQHTEYVIINEKAYEEKE